MTSVSRISLGLGVAFALHLSVQTVHAIPPILEQFQAKYVSEDQNPALAELVKSAKCNICHVQGKAKSMRNAYGMELAKLLKKDQLKSLLESEPDKAKQQIAQALDKVAELAAAHLGDDAPTYGQIIQVGRLPGAKHDLGDLAQALTAAPAQKVSTPSVAPSSDSTAGLFEALLIQLKMELKTEIEQELRQKMREELLAEIRSGLPDQVRTVLAEEQQAKQKIAQAAIDEEIIDKIEEIGGTVREIAMNDDRRSVDFHLSGKSLNDDGLAYVKELSRVIHLHLKNTQISDKGLVHLKNMQSLKKLHLEETGITDAGLQHLQHLANLEWLNIYGTKVTDAGIDQLAAIPNLKKLYIWQTGITIPGFQKLKQSMPNAEIIPDLVKEKQRAEEEAKRKIEEEKRKAEEEKKKAEEEAKKKAEEEAKKKAEEEAKKKAEEGEKEAATDSEQTEEVKKEEQNDQDKEKEEQDSEAEDSAADEE